MQLVVGVAQGVGPPTRTSTSPTSLPKRSAIGVCTKLRPPSSERATWVPLACHATQTVPSERSTATDGSVAFVSASGDTCSVNASINPAPAPGAAAPTRAASRAEIQRSLRIVSLRFRELSETVLRFSDEFKTSLFRLIRQSTLLID